MATQSNPSVANTEEDASSERKPWALKSLPPFPAVALQLLGLLDDEDVAMKDVVGLLRIDPALSAEILRVSNSALYGLSRRIDNVSHAIVVLGTEVVKRLALTVALGRFSQRFMHNQGLRICWDHSVAGALVAEHLATAMKQPTDRAYTAGLLHDLGRLALLACYPVEYGNLLDVARENDFDELECERQLFDIDHCGAGEWLARSWNLPPDFVEAIAQHHSSEPNDASLVSIISAANAIADAVGFNVLEMPAKSSVAEIIAKMPIEDHEATAEELEGFGDQIRSTIAAVTPGAGSRRS